MMRVLIVDDEPPIRRLLTAWSQAEGATVVEAGSAEHAVSLVAFNIQVLHTPPGSEQVFEFQLRGCRLMGRALNPAEGTDAETVDVPLSVIEIVDIVNGKEVVML